MKPKSYNKSYKKSYKVTTNGDVLQMRDGPGTNYKILAKIANGKTVKCDGHYTNNWLYVKYETSKTIYEGFCYKTYLK